MITPRVYILSETLDVALAEFCRATGQQPADVLADAVTLHLDEMGERVAADAVEASSP